MRLIPLGALGATAIDPAAGIPDDLGRIRAGDGRTYQITRDDVLWIARAAKAEGGSRAATIWTWAWRYFVKGWSGSLASLVRAHSQPVNPAWDASTDERCVANPDRCTPAQLQRRAAVASLTFAETGAAGADALAFAQARLANPAPRATDFADAVVSRAFLARPVNVGAEVVLERGNWYIAEREAKALPADFVVVEHGGRVAGPSAIPPALRTWAPWLIGGAALLAIGVGVTVALRGSRSRASRRGGGLLGLGYPPQKSCNLSYADFRGGWTFKEAYDHLAFRKNADDRSFKPSTKAIRNEMARLKRVEYERYLADCAAQAEYEAALEPEPVYGWDPDELPAAIFDFFAPRDEDAPLDDDAPLSTCTRNCRRGKPCGATCVARKVTCRSPSSTACDADRFAVFDGLGRRRKARRR